MRILSILNLLTSAMPKFNFDIFRPFVLLALMLVAQQIDSYAQCSPPTYALSHDMICRGSSVTVTAASDPGTTVRWFTVASGGTPFFEGPTYVTPALMAGTTMYYISSHTATCSSTRVQVALTTRVRRAPVVRMVGLIPGEAKVKLKATLNYDKPEPTINTATLVVRWYDQGGGGGVMLHEGLEFVTPTLTATTTYYAAIANTAGGCASGRTAFTVALPLATASQTKTDVIRVAGITESSLISNLSTSQKNTAITLLDGFGRPVQQSTIQRSPTGKNVVQPIEYDALGRTSIQYLPYTAASAPGVLDATFKMTQAAFYNTPSDAVADDAMPYTQTVVEASPLGRTTEQGGVGTDFQPGSGHTQRMAYSYNVASEVRKFAPDGSSTGFYPANTLKMLTATDPNGNKTIVYEDSQGRTILTKQQLDKTIQGVSTPYLETYYIYDELSRVRYVISPKGVAAMKSSSWAFTDVVKTQYVFESVYDYRSRVVEKRTPGQASTYYVYDKLNRLVLVQDGLLRVQNKWIFIKYDRKERPVMQGLYRNATNVTRASVQALVDALYTPGNAAYPENNYFESRGSVLHGYTNVGFPKVNADNSAVEVLGVNYYESYDFDYNGSRDFKYDSLAFPGQATTSDWRAYGLPTGSKQLVLGTSTWLYSYAFYDRYGRAIQSRSNNHLNPSAIDNVSTAVYDFEGKTLAVKTYHNAGTGKQTTVVNRYEYDVMGRLLRVYQNNNSAPADQLLVEYVYNELGQVVDKKLHQVSGTTFLQSVDYRYSIQGWLKSINNAKLESNTTNNDDIGDYFGLELRHNTQEANLNNKAYYDGNISAVIWKGIGEPSSTIYRRSYKFTYDKANSLESAVSQMHNGSNWSREVGALNEQLSYDQNGNILTLQRNQRKYLAGTTGSYTSEAIDNLTYTYDSQQANRLLKVEDASGNLAGFKNDADVATEYTYDVNGNTLTDQNKGIANVVYNFLGKPDQITFNDGRKLEYVYSAGGTKLTMKTYQGTTLQTTTDYVGSFVYENGALQFFSSPEGRVVKNGSALEYQYSIADHQGNSRVVFTSATPTPDAAAANFEAATNTAFQNYINRSSLEIFDHTDTGPTSTYSQLLNGGVNGQVGLAKTLKVYPGDKVKIDAYAKYWNLGEGSSNLSEFASMLTSAFGLSSTATGEALRAFNAVSSRGTLVAAGTAHGNVAGDPKGFVTIMLFDKDHNFLDAAWDQLDDSYSQGTNIAVKDAFDHLQQEVTIKEEGYAYIYLSNESPTLIDIFFDDVTVTHTKSRVIQYNEYYPFGLQTSSSWTRESTTGNRFLYNQGSELNTQSGWYETPFRSYDAALGRFMQVDALATATVDFNPYHYAANNPVMFSDPSGLSKQRSSASFYWDTDTNQWIDRSADSGPGGDRGDDNFYRFSMQGYFYQSALPGSGNHWGDKLFSNPTRDHSLMNGNAFQNKYGISSYDYRNWTQAQRQATPYTGSVWDHGWAGNSMNEYRYVDGKAVGMTSYNIYEGGGGFPNDYTFGSENKDRLSSFEKALVAINEFNPVANGYDAILGFVSGADRFGDSQSIGESSIKAASVVPWGKLITYSSKFYRAYPAFEKFIGKKMMEIHHRIPQRYIDNGLFPESMRASLSNLQALPYKIHRSVVTPAWNEFSRLNPNATRAQIMKFAIEMDKKISQYIGAIGR